jgi:hypothetical protein
MKNATQEDGMVTINNVNTVPGDFVQEYQHLIK